MKCRDVPVIAMGAVLSCASHLAQPAELAIRVPDTTAARAAAKLISRAERAIRRYMDACESTDARDPWDVVTHDARIEYTLNDPGAYLSLEASSIFAGCASGAGSIGGNLWIYPTGESSTVFVQYDLPFTDMQLTTGSKVIPPQQLALIEMRGDRIYRMRNFDTVPAPLTAAMEGRAQSELCASLSHVGGSLAANMASHAVEPLQIEVVAGFSTP